MVKAAGAADITSAECLLGDSNVATAGRHDKLKLAAHGCLISFGYFCENAAIRTYPCFTAAPSRAARLAPAGRPPMMTTSYTREDYRKRALLVC